MPYLITFACYGAHVHGDETPTIDRKHNMPRTPMLDENFRRAFAERRAMEQRPYLLDALRRNLVLRAIIERCAERGWGLIAAHIRSNHVHLVVDANSSPERVMNDLKSYASRCLNRGGFDSTDRKRWARHGSTRWLHGRDEVNAAVKYVLEKQGELMAVYGGPERG